MADDPVHSHDPTLFSQSRHTGAVVLTIACAEGILAERYEVSLDLASALLHRHARRTSSSVAQTARALVATRLLTPLPDA